MKSSSSEKNRGKSLSLLVSVPLMDSGGSPEKNQSVQTIGSSSMTSMYTRLNGSTIKKNPELSLEICWRRVKLGLNLPFGNIGEDIVFYNMGNYGVTRGKYISAIQAAMETKAATDT